MEFKDVEESRQFYNDKIIDIKDPHLRSKMYLQYKKAYKAYFVQYQLQSIFKNIEYDHNQGIDIQTLRRTGLIDVGDDYYANDLVSAKYKSISFTQSDVEILKKRYEDYADEFDPVAINTRSDTMFKGRFLIFTFHKKVLRRVAILPTTADQFFKKPIIEAGLSPIETESVHFNRLFHAYTEDGFEAFYILDPAFIESVERFADRYCYKIALYFMGNKMFIGLNDHNNSFEPPDSALPVDEAKEKAKVIEDMKLITDIVDSLKLT